MDKIWLDILLLEESIVLTKPKKLMEAVFDVDRNISWEMNLMKALKQFERRVGVIDLAGRDLDLTVIKLHEEKPSDMMGLVTDAASITV
jgi:hypothetical protein